MNDRQMSKLFWAVKGTLVAVLLYVAVEAVMAPFQLDAGLKPKAVAGDERPQTEMATKTSSQAQEDYSVILDNDLFSGSGQVPAAESAPAEPPAEPVLPSAEKLGLKLRGTVAGGPTTSRAIIEDASTKMALLYKIGDRVGPATIESIEPERVILLHGGRKAVLPLHVTMPGKEAPAPAPQKPQPARPKPVATTPQPSARLGYVEELFRKATIKPYVKEGHIEGLEITGLEETPLTKLFGLQNGDIVQTVNGQDLNSKQKAFQVLKKARTQSKIDLQLLRDGEAKELSFDL